MDRLRNYLNSRQSWLAGALSSLAGIYYLVIARGYAHSQLSRLDEGLYQVKGFYFAIGRYFPFEDFGLWTNHMPLSFLIPGQIQKWFGPGIRTGRYFAIFLGAAALMGIWMLARRLGGRWWAAAAVWAIVMNTAWIKIHSIGLSNALISAFLAWTLYFALSEERQLWQDAAAGLFAGLLMLTRINLAPLTGLLPLYLWWQHGKKSGITAALTSGIVILAVHWIYFPGILSLWAYWVPEGLLPFLEPWISPARKVYVEVSLLPVSAWIGNFDHTVWDSIRSFLHGVRFNFVSMVGVAVSLLLWPPKEKWRSSFAYKTSIFLLAMFVILLGFHMWAALLAKSCHIWCFPNYVMFFAPLGLLLIILTAGSWEGKLPRWRQALAAVFVLALGLGIGLGSLEETSAQLLNIKLPKWTFNPLIYHPRSYILWGVFERRWGIAFEDSVRIIPSLFGLGIGVLLLIITFFGLRALQQRGRLLDRSWGWSLLVVVLIVGMAFSPSRILGEGLRTHDCGGDVIRGYEQVGRELAELIPAGSQLYLWYKPTLPLLYIPDALIYPPQMNFTFSLMYPNELSEWVRDSDDLLRYGFWDEVVMEEWLQEADYILVEGHRLKTDWQDRIDAGEFMVYAITSPAEPCRSPGSQVVILQRVE